MAKEKTGRGPLSILDEVEVVASLPLELTSPVFLVPSALGGTNIAMLLGGGIVVE